MYSGIKHYRRKLEEMIATDLFTHKSAKDRLLEWMRQKKYIKTSEICQWGVDNYSPDRASRNARQLASEGKIRRMPKQKKIFYFGNIKEDIYEIIKFPESCL